MARVVLYTLTSLDGAVDGPHRFFPETPDRPGVPVFDDDLAALEAEVVARQRAVLLGRGTYDQWSRYWPTSDEQPFAGFINTVPRYVLTSSPLDPGWGPVEAVSGPLAAVVADLRSRVDGDIGVHGSITLAQGLLQEGLVDELCLAVGRVLDPVGRRWYASVDTLRELELVQAVPTSSGSVFLRYRVLPPHP